MVTAWQQQQEDQIKYTRLELWERERRAARILDYAITHCGATFPLKKLQAAFNREISHRQIEALGQQLEDLGILEKQGGPRPRLVIVGRARQYIERQQPPATPGGGDPNGLLLA